MELEHHELDGVRWQVARRIPARELRPLLGQALEGWVREGPQAASYFELPFPGIPLIINLESPWRVDDARLDSFLAGLQLRPATVTGERRFSCLELRLTPLGTRRLLGRPLHELADRTVALQELLPGTDALVGRLQETPHWGERFDLVESFLSRQLADTPAPPRELDWAWRQLVRSGGLVRVHALADELGWSPRRLIERFRDHIGLSPKAAARVIRFDRAVAALQSGQPRIAEVAAACGYADQAHLGRELRELGGVTPGRLVSGNFVQDGGAGPA